MAAVEEFCCLLDLGSCLQKEYNEQLHTKNVELKQLNLHIANLMLEGIKKGSIAWSDKPDRAQIYCLAHSGSILSSAYRLCLNVGLAKMHLQQVQREQECAKGCGIAEG